MSLKETFNVDFATNNLYTSSLCEGCKRSPLLTATTFGTTCRRGHFLHLEIQMCGTNVSRWPADPAEHLHDNDTKTVQHIRNPDGRKGNPLHQTHVTVTEAAEVTVQMFSF